MPSRPVAAQHDLVSREVALVGVLESADDDFVFRLFDGMVVS